MPTSDPGTLEVPPSKDHVMLLLCPDPDTVMWCRLAEEFTRSIFTNVQAIYWGRGAPFPEELENWSGEWLISFRGDLVVPERIYSRATKGAINIHPSPPHFRGLGGQYYAIYEGHAIYGTTCHHMAPSVDSGAIIDARLFSITPGETTSVLRQHVGAHSLAQYFDLVSDYIAKDVPLPKSKYEWGDKLYTTKELACWMEEKKATEPDHRCFK